MPIDDFYKEELKSNFADMANIGGPAGGSVMTRLFSRTLHTQIYLGSLRHRRHRIEEKCREGLNVISKESMQSTLDSLSDMVKIDCSTIIININSSAAAYAYI